MSENMPYLAELTVCPTCQKPMSNNCEECYPSLGTESELTPAILKRLIDVAYQFEHEVQDFNVALQQDEFLHAWAAKAIVKLNQLANYWKTHSQEMSDKEH